MQNQRHNTLVSVQILAKKEETKQAQPPLSSIWLNPTDKLLAIETLALMHITL